MPAQKRNRLRQQKRTQLHNKTNNKGNKYTLWKFFVIIGAGIVFFAIYHLFLKTKYWNPGEKLTVAVQEKSGDISVYVLDIPREEVVRISIPGNTEVEVADNLGVWKLKSVWELGKQERKDGNLLARTITKFFKFPVYTWAGEGFVKLAEGKPKGIIETKNSNFSLGDKFKLFLYFLKIKNVNREEISLADTKIIKKTTLKDGEEGFVLSGFDSPRVSSKFSDYDFSEEIVRVQIINASRNNRIVEDSGDILEVMGAKVSAITKAEEEEIFCEISGRENMKDAVGKVEQLLGCRETNYENGGNFDLILKIGSKFN